MLRRQLTLFKDGDKKLVDLKEASIWASEYLNRKVTVSNISYLIQYGRIKKYGDDGNPLVDINELKCYYDSSSSKEKEWQSILGEDINWHLSFSQYKEAERTKHVHRLHPYKGKFIPQLVEYFLDSHIDEFKSVFQSSNRTYCTNIHIKMSIFRYHNWFHVWIYPLRNAG